MKKIVILSLLSVGLATTSFSQGKLGIIGGLSVSKYAVSGSDVTTNTTSITSFHLGFLYDVSISSNIYVQPQLLLSGKGGKDIGGKSNPYYIEVPINFLYKSALASGKIFGGVGPYGAVGVFGNANDGSGSRKLLFGSTDNDDIRRADFGLNFIAGYEFDAGLILNVNYSLGLANILPGTLGDEANGYNRYFGISIGYLFGENAK